MPRAFNEYKPEPRPNKYMPTPAQREKFMGAARYFGKAVGDVATSIYASYKKEEPNVPKKKVQMAKPSTTKNKGDMASSSSSKPEEVVTDLSPYIKIYNNKRVERLFEPPYAPPSLNDPMISSKDITISTDLFARMYIPAETLSRGSDKEKLPILVYYHGGGFCLDSAFSTLSHSYINQLTEEANVIAISVEYRRAPEHSLPEAFDDSWKSLQWVASHLSEQEQEQKPAPGRIEQAKGMLKAFQKRAYEVASSRSLENPNTKPKEEWLINHGNFDKLFVAGDSAGATIAHYMGLKAGFEPDGLTGGVKILGTILCFPYFCDEETDEKSIACKMWMMAYPKCPNGIKNLYINPFPEGPSHHTLQFQRMFVCYGGEDEHRRVDMRFADVMKAEKNWSGDVTEVEVKGEKHCFHLFDPTTKNARSLIIEIKNFINR